MPLDPVQRDDARAWLARAAADLRAAANELSAEEPVLGDLGVLGGQCVEIDPALTKVLRSAAPMTEYAWKFRYPGDVFEPPREEVDRALAPARDVMAKIESLVR